MWVLKCKWLWALLNLFYGKRVEDTLICWKTDVSKIGIGKLHCPVWKFIFGFTIKHVIKTKHKNIHKMTKTHCLSILVHKKYNSQNKSLHYTQEHHPDPSLFISLTALGTKDFFQIFLLSSVIYNVSLMVQIHCSGWKGSIIILSATT